MHELLFHDSFDEKIEISYFFIGFLGRHHELLSLHFHAFRPFIFSRPAFCRLFDYTQHTHCVIIVSRESMTPLLLITTLLFIDITSTAITIYDMQPSLTMLTL